MASSVSMKRQVRDSGSKPTAQRVQLHLAVAVGEVGEHEERTASPASLRWKAPACVGYPHRPSGRQQIIGLLAAVAPKYFCSR